MGITSTTTAITTIKTTSTTRTTEIRTTSSRTITIIAATTMTTTNNIANKPTTTNSTLPNTSATATPKTCSGTCKDHLDKCTESQCKLLFYKLVLCKCSCGSC